VLRSPVTVILAGTFRGEAVTPLVMDRIKMGLQIAGVAIAAVGALCLPVGFSVNPKRDLSAFFNLADMGIFLKVALVLIPFGSIVFAVGYMLPGGEPEDMLRFGLGPVAATAGGCAEMGRVRAWLGRLFNAVPSEEMEGIQLQGPCWEVAGRRVDQADFFRALAGFVPEGSILFLEGGAHPAPVRKFLEEHAVPQEAKIALGTVWPRSTVFHLQATGALLRQLADLAQTCASPELCIHLHVYNSGGVLLQWYDAFSDPFYVSQRLPPERLEAFCGVLKTPWKDADLPRP